MEAGDVRCENFLQVGHDLARLDEGEHLADGEHEADALRVLQPIRRHSLRESVHFTSALMGRAVVTGKQTMAR